MDKQALNVIYTNLDSALQRQVSALPDKFNKQRFLQNCMTVLQDGKTDFSKCEAGTVVRTLLKGAFLGLDFFNGECYAIPYGNQCNFQTDYKGEVKVCKRYSSNPIKDIYAKLVREGDVFEERIENGAQSINFNPKPFNDGAIIGAFAVCYYTDGSMLYDTMSLNEIENTRKTYSKIPNSKAWKDSFGEMAKKTVLRRLCKMIDLNFDTAEANQAYEDGSDTEVRNGPQKEKTEAHDVYADDKVVADGAYKEVADNTTQAIGGVEEDGQITINQ
jgi:recombinase, phage recT family